MAELCLNCCFTVCVLCVCLVGLVDFVCLGL